MSKVTMFVVDQSYGEAFEFTHFVDMNNGQDFERVVRSEKLATAVTKYSAKIVKQIEEDAKAKGWKNYDSDDLENAYGYNTWYRIAYVGEESIERLISEMLEDDAVFYKYEFTLEQLNDPSFWFCKKYDSEKFFETKKGTKVLKTGKIKA